MNQKGRKGSKMNDVDVSKKMQAPAKGVPVAKCKTI